MRSGTKDSDSDDDSELASISDKQSETVDKPDIVKEKPAKNKVVLPVDLVIRRSCGSVKN